MTESVRMAVVVWDLEPPRCSLCTQDGKSKRATKRVEVTLWHGAHGRTINYECCDEHGAEWAAKMEGVAERMKLDA